MAAPADGVSRPSRHLQYYADDEEDNPEHQKDMGEDERRHEARKEESEDDEDDSQDDHDVLPSFWVEKFFARTIARIGVEGGTYVCPDRFWRWRRGDR
jgi:hypothetical protein